MEKLRTVRRLVGQLAEWHTGMRTIGRNMYITGRETSTLVSVHFQVFCDLADLWLSRVFVFC
jgi:hypothetical protein